jgi:hypothetical protein
MPMTHADLAEAREGLWCPADAAAVSLREPVGRERLSKEAFDEQFSLRMTSVAFMALRRRQRWCQ